ncbi:unnamed protein product [Moneuplotes crassus]|uniref:Ribokinase n=1 Tax=Euplotes crassus TaxID=5936 RepID=A0AAD1XNN8_EUPCR|nr:unnamed protein product [Moneuplotes crassus]
MEDQDQITVLGSLNGDIFMKVKNLPKAGETIACSEITKASGGKGANQAAALARLAAGSGVTTNFLCQVGADEIADMVLKELRESGASPHPVVLENTPSGQAYIFSMPDGENSIVIHGGANTNWDEGLTELNDTFTEKIKNSKLLLLQREIPEHVNIIAAQLARDNNVTVVLDAGGMDTSISDDLLKRVDIFSPNETELERVLGSDFDKSLSGIYNAAKLREKFPNLSILLKLGANGSAFISQDYTLEAPAVTDFKGKSIIDTTGAGDCFTACFALKLAQGCSLKDAVEYSNTAAFLCITKFGAMPSLPYAQDVVDFIEE